MSAKWNSGTIDTRALCGLHNTWRVEAHRISNPGRRWQAVHITLKDEANGWQIGQVGTVTSHIVRLRVSPVSQPGYALHTGHLLTTWGQIH